MNINHENAERETSSVSEMIETLNAKIENIDIMIDEQEKILVDFPDCPGTRNAIFILAKDKNELIDKREKLMAIKEKSLNIKGGAMKEPKQFKSVNEALEHYRSVSNVPFASGEQERSDLFEYLDKYEEQEEQIPNLKITYKTNKSYEKTDLAHTWIMNENVKTKEDRYLTYQNFFFKENIVEYMNMCGGAILINEHKDGGVIYETTGEDIEEYLKSVRIKLEKVLGCSINEVVIHDTTFFGNVENGKHEFVKYDIQLKGNK